MLVELTVTSTNSVISIRLSDNGIGMESHQVEKTFRPYYTIDLERGSAGLGMTVVYNTFTQLRAQ